MSMNTPTGSITQTTAIKDFIELENIDTQQYLLGINDIATGDGSKIKLEKILKDSISTDTGNTLEIGSDNKLLNIEEDTGVQAGDYTYPQNLVVNSKGRITSVTSGSPASVPIATTLHAGIVKPDGNTITVANDGTINANILGYEVGDIITRNTPTNDAGKHLLDGALIQYGSYQAFVDYIADLYNNTPAEDVYNVDIVGSLTNNNGVLSRFSTSNYAKLPEPFSPSNKNWEIQLKFTTNDSSTTNQQIFADGDSSSPYNGVYIVIQNGFFNFGISYNGTTWDLNLINNSVAPVANTEYLLKLSFDGVQYLMQVSTNNGESWVNAGSAKSSSTIANTTKKQALGLAGYSSTNPFNGSIDLNGCHINIGGQRWWSGKTERRAGFLTEVEWQQTVATYGSCGKYVYDSVNNTVRLPKVSDILQGTTDLTALGDLIEAGLPDHNHYTSLPTCETDGGSGRLVLGNGGNPTTSLYISNNASTSNSIYGNSTTVQPQTIKVLYYIVIANSTNTDVQVDINKIATDLNSKADVDLTNVNNAGTSMGAGWAMPSDTYVDLTLGASGTTYTAPANGWFWVRHRPSSNGGGTTININKNDVFIYGTSMKTVANAVFADFLPVKKGAILTFYYDSGTDTAIRFIYAQGSESEAQ